MLVTAFTVAAVSAWLVVVPLTFGTALVLGAIVAPPDAVTAVAVGRKLGLPKRVMAILTGESLINDAAALTLFLVAVAQVAGTHTFIESPVLLFAYSAVVGPAVGAALGYTTLWIRNRLNNPGLETIKASWCRSRRSSPPRNCTRRVCSASWWPVSWWAAER